MAGTEMDGGWQEELLARWDEYADTDLGPKIRDDAKRYAPVDSGALRDSIENHMGEDHTLIVSATGGADGRVYAAWVELGHRVAHGRGGPVGPEMVPPEPFLKPALFTQRG